MYLGLWAVEASHSTATLSSGGLCGLYGLRLMHRPNISLSCFGPRAGQAIYFCRLAPLTLTLWRSHVHIRKVCSTRLNTSVSILYTSRYVPTARQIIVINQRILTPNTLSV